MLFECPCWVFRFGAAKEEIEPPVGDAMRLARSARRLTAASFKYHSSLKAPGIIRRCVTALGSRSPKAGHRALRLCEGRDFYLLNFYRATEAYQILIWLIIVFEKCYVRCRKTIPGSDLVAVSFPDTDPTSLSQHTSFFSRRGAAPSDRLPDLKSSTRRVRPTDIVAAAE
ncbi:hypothetical protein EVAR_95753_1 [Eumeta japonica]|uniref:Uncharacterized protein n=1 Tax=Eumeta variegata TaxID=151549 RepID=A0A4C1ULJ2_EUMVA|nr:hypothetical protein EVAR_95753_1 [Eumeta japonica]